MADGDGVWEKQGKGQNSSTGWTLPWKGLHGRQGWLQCFPPGRILQKSPCDQQLGKGWDRLQNCSQSSCFHTGGAERRPNLLLSSFQWKGHLSSLLPSPSMAPFTFHPPCPSFSLCFLVRPRPLPTAKAETERTQSGFCKASGSFPLRRRKGRVRVQGGIFLFVVTGFQWGLGAARPGLGFALLPRYRDFWRSFVVKSGLWL